ncbi:hypothetical protein EZV62_002188 [Acer yangbiense]|uniref:Uncharacterized protein n=1 Tax=Acer yangbiense TaxID=1000413 RepID=A0A5C7IWY5_9ROSI|nr:hypothetical protein EZV62_002188 [Acer yangbiense]
MVLCFSSLVDSERPLEMERHDVSFVLYKVIEAKIVVEEACAFNTNIGSLASLPVAIGTWEACLSLLWR